MIRKEGFPYIGVSVLLSLALFFLNLELLGVLFLILAFFFIYFFRDPERVPPNDPNSVISPADGLVIRVSRDSQLICPQGTTEISIFMSPFDVHVNRVPFDGEVKVVQYTPGKFHSAFKEEALRENENIKVVLNTQYGEITLRQVAGVIARRAICWIKEGDMVKRGERFGMIKFSSRVDICLPARFRVTVKEGDKVKAGESVIALVDN